MLTTAVYPLVYHSRVPVSVPQPCTRTVQSSMSGVADCTLTVVIGSTRLALFFGKLTFLTRAGVSRSSVAGS